jgi:tRNA G18 (ribose-2'-O)-methylase SpoU
VRVRPEAADLRVRSDMASGVDSLNADTTTAIALHHLRR